MVKGSNAGGRSKNLPEYPFFKKKKKSGNVRETSFKKSSDSFEVLKRVND